MATTVSVDYGAGASAVTLGLATGPLASDTTLVAGRESNAIDNTTTKALDYHVEVKITTGTSPTASRQIEVWVAMSVDGTTYTGGATGSDANLTPTEKTLMSLAKIMPTDNTSNKAYTCAFSLADVLGLREAPQYSSIFVVHNTGVALNSTGGNHFVKATPIKRVGA